MSVSQVFEPWATEDDLPAAAVDKSVSPSVLSKALLFASEVLFNITQRRWPGLATDVYRPCCSCAGPVSCECARWSALELPNTPARSVTQVLVDGVVVAPEEYELRDGGWVHAVRQPDGTLRSWLRCQDLTLPPTAVGTMQVTYRWGTEPPPAGRIACGVLAWEFAVAWTPTLEGQCRLPKRVTSVTRAGITVAAIDPLTLFEKGLTGIPEVDVWTSSLTVGTKRLPGRVHVPGARAGGTRRTL